VARRALAVPRAPGRGAEPEAAAPARGGGRAEAAYRAGPAPLAAVEGFIRQILGWREYVRGIYWTRMPGYAELNALDAQQPLPAWYWTGDTDMACLRDAIGQTLRTATPTTSSG
jgi:deoxyribodipyrimidine photolyase-like uncharacterized protein